MNAFRLKKHRSRLEAKSKLSQHLLECDQVRRISIDCSSVYRAAAFVLDCSFQRLIRHPHHPHLLLRHCSLQGLAQRLKLLYSKLLYSCKLGVSCYNVLVCLESLDPLLYVRVGSKVDLGETGLVDCE